MYLIVHHNEFSFFFVGTKILQNNLLVYSEILKIYCKAFLSYIIYFDLTEDYICENETSHTRSSSSSIHNILYTLYIK